MISRDSKNKIICFILSLLVAVSVFALGGFESQAHDRYTKVKKGVKEIGHDNELELILFGEDYGGENSKRRPKSVKAVEDAAYLCIDQFNNVADGVKIPGTDDLSNLVRQGVFTPFNTPKLSDFSYKDTAHHRIHTHEGWKNKYPKEVKDKSGNTSDWDEVWATRKAILVNTVYHEFGYVPAVSNFNGDAAKMRSFAQFVYYMHILGDVESTKGFDAYRDNPLVVLAYNHATASEDEYEDVICELKKCCETMFGDTTDQQDYTALIQDLTAYHSKAQLYVGSPKNYYYSFYEGQVLVRGRVLDSHGFEEYQKVATDLIEKTLKKRIPKLLEDAEFYQNSRIYDEINQMEQDTAA